MMDRAKVLTIKRTASKMDYHPTTQTIHALADALLEALDKLDGGVDQKAIERGYQERERQLKLALADVIAMAAAGDIAKARYALDCAQQMLKAKGPAWTREWSYYTPRIEEEFSA